MTTKPWVKIGEERRLTADIRARAARAARGFEQAGVGPGDVVATLLRNDFPVLEVMIGAGMAGAYVVPVNWHNTADEARYVLENCSAKVLVIHADLLRRLPDITRPGVQVVVAKTPPVLCTAYRVAVEDASVPAGMSEWESWLDSFEPKPPPYAIAPGSMIYTSGTTGLPKGVRRNPPTPQEFEANMEVLRLVGGLHPWVGRMHEVVMLIPGPAYHSGPSVWMTGLLALGANICLEPRFDARRTLEQIEHERVTHVLAVPTMYVRWLALDESVRTRYDLSSVAHVMHIGAPCPPHIKRAMIDWWGPVVTEFYGSTEIGAATYCNAQDWLDHPGTVGRVIDGAVVVVMDQAGNALPPGEVGEIMCVREVFPDFTYHGDDEKRRRAARGQLIATGDMGYFDADGFLYLSGRTSDMIIFGGTNIYPAEIEAELMKLPGVADCAVFGIPDPAYGEQVCAFIQLQSGATLDADRVRRELGAHLAGYKLPRHIEFVASLPREESGKIFKRKLRDPFWEGRDRKI